MAAADILFMSHERLPSTPEQWARELSAMYPAEIIVIGLGAHGALLVVRSDHVMRRLPAINVRPVVNSIGAGDALFACFLHEYLLTLDPYLALRKAMIFAAYKIGTKGAAQGFLDSAGLDALCNQFQVA